jgi:hypothetical protein
VAVVLAARLRATFFFRPQVNTLGMQAYTCVHSKSKIIVKKVSCLRNKKAIYSFFNF